MRTIAVINQKGGSGKTTTCVNLAAALAEHGRRVLIVDLDQQYNATTWFQRLGQGRGARALFDDPEQPVTDLVVPTGIEGLELIPSAKSMYGVERFLAGETGAELTLKARLAELPGGAYDYLFFDCPASLGLVTINALAAAREVMVPVQAQVLALQGIDKLVETVEVVRRKGLNPDLAITGIVACQAKLRTRHGQEVIAALRQDFPEACFRTVIRDNVRLSECPSQGVPITVYAPDSAGAADYRALAEEVITQEAKEEAAA